MSKIINDNNRDDHIDDLIYECIRIDDPKSFFLFAGAGSGKTRSLVNVLSRFQQEQSSLIKLKGQKIAIITYTNAACDEIKSRLNHDSLFSVSTIHSFVWDLIEDFQSDIKGWVKISTEEKIVELEELLRKGRVGTATAINRQKKIDSKKRRLENLKDIKKFIYNPNGDNISRDSLNHSEVISIGANFLNEKKLMKHILVRQYPILLIDESQDTNKLLMEAFFNVQKEKSDIFTLGLFGDTMQRIYSDGKLDLGINIPKEWEKPAKIMNHRCPKRVVRLINKIRSEVDEQEQQPRTDKEEGYVRFFIVSSDSANKPEIEKKISNKMAEITDDKLWTGGDSDVKVLTLEHHLAARRMGFVNLFAPLYSIKSLRTGILDGTNSAMRLFTQILLPLIKAKFENDEFSVCRIVKKYSQFLSEENLKKEDNQIKKLKNAKDSVDQLFLLWDRGQDPQLLDVLQKVAQLKLFSIPEVLAPIAYRSAKEQSVAEAEAVSQEEGENNDDIIDAWDKALSSLFSEVELYNDYIEDKAQFGTHQGIKGLEFPRVMVILDDEEAGGFLFSYEKLFGAKEYTPTDIKNMTEGRETSIDRTRRLFYVICSRSEKSLAIVNYTKDPEKVKQFVLSQEWFSEEEIINI
jgi:DNA helicase-2/ATP-dependent DNA helicase PcrA